MKRTMVAALAVLFSTIVLADEPQRYLVATKRPFKAGALTAVIRDARNGVAPRDVAGFEAFNGFAAALTSSEVAALRASREVRWVEPVIERYATAESRNFGGQTIPYGIDMLHAREAGKGRRIGVVNVAVTDTGIDYRHDELRDFYAGGHNVLDPSGVALDDAGHGTHVAGTIAAADNNFGVLGVAPNVRLWGVKVLNSRGSGTNESVIGGIDWVIARKKEIGGNWILNLSLGAARSSAAEKEAIDRAVQAGILIVAAAGNESTTLQKAPLLYPAAYPDVVAVGAIDETATIASFSNQGPELDLVAPGVRVLSTVPVGTAFLSTVSNAGRRFMADPLEGSDTGRLSGDFVYCGLGKPEEFPESVRGRIAVIRRGELAFARKARNAVEAGATGVVIFNNVDGTFNWTLRSIDLEPWSITYDFPIVVGLSRADGETLIQKGGTLDIAIDPDDYLPLSGTSMATPHVVGVAALMWSMAPHAKPADIINSLRATAVDLGAAGPDATFGAGMVDALAAAKHLAPYAFTSGPTTGRIIGKR